MLGHSFRELARPPFPVLLALSLMTSLVGATLTDQDELTLVVALFLNAISLYIDIAVILAAGSTENVRSADTWLKGAFLRRCFWRFVATEILAILLVVVGAVALVVGAFVVGGIVALSLPAAVIDRHHPTEAIRLSATITKPVRVATAVIFGLLFILPFAAVQGGFQLGLPQDLGTAWHGVIAGAVILSMTGTIALTRAYVVVTGHTTPALADLRPKPDARRPSR